MKKNVGNQGKVLSLPHVLVEYSPYFKIQGIFVLLEQGFDQQLLYYIYHLYGTEV